MARSQRLDWRNLSEDQLVKTTAKLKAHGKRALFSYHTTYGWSIAVDSIEDIEIPEEGSGVMDAINEMMADIE